MKNNNLIEYKENLFTRIFNFFKNLFSRKNVSDNKIIKESNINIKNKNNFFEDIQFKENKEEIELKRLQLLYDNGEIDEDDLSEEEIEKLVSLYKKETEKLNADTERRKNHISQMLKELKHS